MTTETEQFMRLRQQEAERQAEAQRVENQRRAEEEARKQAEEQQRQEEAARQEAAKRASDRIAELERERAKNEAMMQDPAFRRQLLSTGESGYKATEQSIKTSNETRNVQIALLTEVDRAERQLDRVEELKGNPNYIINQADIDRVREQLNESKTAIAAITSKDLAPFVKYTKDGKSYVIDVNAAVKAGVSDKVLTAAGISKAKILRSKTGKGKADKFVTPEEAKRSTQLARFVENVSKRQTALAVKKLEKYVDPKTKALDVEKAIKGGVSYLDMQKAGYRISKKNYETVTNYQQSTGEERFNYLVKTGVIPEGSVYAGTDDQGNPTYYTKTQTDVMKKLEKYEYNVPLMLKQNIITENELLEVGFAKDDVLEAVNQVKASKETGVALAGESKYLRNWYSDFNKAEIALNAKIEELETRYPTYSKNKIAELASKTPEFQAISSINSQLDPLKTEQAVATRGAITAASFIFPPAKAGQPEYRMENVTALDWGIGFANVALLVVPMAVPATTAGRFAVTGVQLAAGGIYTADTVKNWSEMSNTQRGISVAVDTVLLASAVLPYAGSIARATNKAFSTVSNEINVTATKSQDMISHLFKKSPVKTTGVSPVKQLTEGGVIGPYKNLTDVELVNLVAKGEKPIAYISNFGDDMAAIQAVQKSGLKLKYTGSIELSSGDMANIMTENGVRQVKITKPTIVKEYVVYADTPTSRLALDKLNKAALIDRTTPEGIIKYHTQVGEALGYKPKDIRAFIDNWAATDAGVKEAWDNVKYAMAINDKTLLQAAAARLQIAAAKLPKQIADPLMRRAKLMQANADDYLELAKRGPEAPGDVGKGLEANKQFIENAERQLRKVSSAKRREEITKAIEEARRQVATKTETETLFDPFAKTMSPEEAKQFLPDIVRPDKATKAVTVTKTKSVPLEKFGTTPLSKISKEYKVTREQLLDAVEELPVGDRIVIYSRNIVGLSEKEKIRILPITLPMVTPGITSTQIKPSIVRSPRIGPQTEFETDTAFKVVPGIAVKIDTSPKPEPKEKPKTAIVPKISTVPDTGDAPMPKPQTAPQPQLDPKQETPIQQKEKLKPRSKGKKDEKKRKWTDEEIKSAIAWKDGFIVHAIKYPYRRGVDEQSFHVYEVPAGLTITSVTGKGSEQKTAVVKGRLRRSLTVDVGNQDKIIRPVQGGKRVTISSRLDRGTTTKSNLTITKQPRTISKKRGRQYYTKIGKSTVVSRRPLRG